MGKENLKYYPVKVLIKWWRTNQITTEELRRLVKYDYLPKELKRS